ncbi:hypothetical protein TorRG33x02_314540 [Trema orientale]|uniref:Uncharacterized protein n=1 Tax=Trema orientale TaxID=63057 RepID=A0A2P5BNN4_TREOI|nr:hypothetical protein TorRG33x02_314540 [Trema orientale]
MKSKTVELSKKNERETTHTYGGFVLPLSVLVYECISAIATEFAQRQENVDIVVPKIDIVVSKICRWKMNWKRRQSPSYSKILTALGKSQEIHALFTPTNEEKEAPYMSGFIQPNIPRNIELEQLTRFLLSGGSITWKYKTIGNEAYADVGVTSHNNATTEDILRFIKT